MPRQRASIASAFRERKLPMEEKKELQNQDERVVEIELERLRGFVNHPFKVQADSQMIELQESIKKYGILNHLIEVSLVNAMSRELILRSMVDRLREFYDYIIIDCMPSLGMMTINALACADSVLIPVQAAYLPVKGLQQLIKTIGRVKKQLNPKLKIEGILLTMVDNRTNYARDISLMVYDTYSASIKVFETEIPMSVRASEVSVEGGSIYSYDPKGKAAFAYMALTKEVLKEAE